MPIDSSIYQMIQQPKIASPFENAQQALTIKSLMEQEKFRPQLQKLELDQKQSALQGQQATTQAANMKVARDSLAGVRTDADLMQHSELVKKLFGPDAAASLPKSVADPEFEPMRNQKLMTADEMLKRLNPELKQVDRGGTTDAVNPYTNKTVSSVPKTPVPASAPRPGKTPLSATAQKELFEADDLINASRNAKALLTKALEFNDAAYSGPTAKSRMVASRLTPNALMTKDAIAGADAATELDNIMTGQALESLKAIFGGMPTEGERKILLDIQASLDKTPKQRKDIIDRAIQLADRRLQANMNKAKALREGTFFSDQPDYPDAELPPVQPATSNAKGGIKFLGFE